jgi:hypothetical protein
MKRHCSLTPPLFIEVPVPIQKSGWPCICVIEQLVVIQISYTVNNIVHSRTCCFDNGDTTVATHGRLDRYSLLFRVTWIHFRFCRVCVAYSLVVCVVVCFCPFSFGLCIIQWNLNKLNLLGITFCVRDRQEFGWCRFFLYWDFIQSSFNTGFRFAHSSV